MKSHQSGECVKSSDERWLLLHSSRVGGGTCSCGPCPWQWVRTSAPPPPNVAVPLFEALIVSFRPSLQDLTEGSKMSQQYPHNRTSQDALHCLRAPSTAASMLVQDAEPHQGFQQLRRFEIQGDLSISPV